MQLSILAVAAYATPSAVANRSTWDGVYTEERSRRGERVYTDACANCLTASLAGGDVVPALTGDEFLKKWNGALAGELNNHFAVVYAADGDQATKPR
jgi:hypothetical protein